MKEILAQYTIGDMKLLYLIDRSSEVIGFTVLPQELDNQYILDGKWRIESLLQLKSIEDNMPAGFSAGHTMRNSGTCWKMKYVNQTVEQSTGEFQIITVLESSDFRGTHQVKYKEESQVFTVETKLENIGETNKTLEMLGSFSMCGLFGFSDQERTCDLKMHRLKSKWSEEGRLETRTFLEMQLEPSWQKYGVQSIRYGQVGSMPVRRFFPWFALEDTRTKCFIGGMLKIPSSWQIEIFSEDDRPAISGGIADREYGHWMKQIKPGEVFAAPGAILTCCVGNLDDLTNRLIERQKKSLDNVPVIERNMPVVFNEFCTTWGQPSEDRINSLLGKVTGKGIDYFVIDAGWHADTEKGWESNMGDWNPNQELFPNGLKQVADNIRNHKMVPGIWFEVETVGRDADIYSEESMLLKRDGYPVTTERRRFLDMRKEEVQQYLEQKVIGNLRDNGFGYLKVDYNDSIGLGCDGEDSLGENLRNHMQYSQKFYKKIREQIPELVMENCSSGGHRLEPSMMELFSMASFSDAHECDSIPIIAANVHRAIHPAQSQIWAVIRSGMTIQRIRYLLAGTFLGRMCISGDVDSITEEQWRLITSGIDFYKEVSGIIRDGKSYRFGSEVQSYAKPNGYQVIVEKTMNEGLIIVHNFNEGDVILESIPQLENFKISKIWGDENQEVRLKDKGLLQIKQMNEFDGLVILVKK